MITRTLTLRFWKGSERNRLEPWLGDLRRACEEARVKLHTDGRTMWIDESSEDPSPCSFCRQTGATLDSAAVIPAEED